MKILLAILLCCTVLISSAQPPLGKSVLKKPAAKKTDVHFCPPAKTLKRKALWWFAPGGWKSYSQSFVRDIKQFTGAQWVGVRFGQIICVYQGPFSETFPVTLQEKYHQVVPSPQGGKWGSYRQGYKNCNSNQPTDCAYLIKKPKKVKDIFKNLQFFDQSHKREKQ